MTLAGSVFVTPVSGDVSGLLVSARTSNPGSRGRYGLFYAARPFDTRYAREAWIHGLQQNSENRSNLAMINVGDVDQAEITLKITLYDGATGNVVKVIEGEATRLASRQFRQIDSILSQAPGTSQGWAHVEQTGGANAFVVYGVVNDGGTPGARSGDGAFLEMDTPVVFDFPQREGRWTDITQGKSGPATGRFRQNTLDQRIELSFDLNDTTTSLGAELPPLTCSGTYSPGGETRLSGVSPAWGPYTVTIKSSGEIAGSLPNIPIPTLTRLDFTGFQTSTMTDIDTLFTLRTGSKISGRLHLEGGSLGTR